MSVNLNTMMSSAMYNSNVNQKRSINTQLNKDTVSFQGGGEAVKIIAANTAKYGVGGLALGTSLAGFGQLVRYTTISENACAIASKAPFVGKMFQMAVDNPVAGGAFLAAVGTIILTSAVEISKLIRNN